MTRLVRHSDLNKRSSKREDKEQQSNLIGEHLASSEYQGKYKPRSTVVRMESKPANATIISGF